MDENLMTFLNDRASFLEEERIKALKKSKIEKATSGILTTVTIIIFLINQCILILTPLLIVFAIILIILKFKKKAKEKFELTLKGDVLPEIFKRYNHDFTYSPTGYNRGILNKSGFLNKDLFSNLSGIVGEDYVKGVIDNVAVEFFEIEVVKKSRDVEIEGPGFLVVIPYLLKKLFGGKRERTSGSLDAGRDSNNFFGFFMYADFHKEFDGKVVMFPKNKETVKDKIYKILDSKSLVKVNVENSYINDNYNIYATDVQIGYYVLSQGLINRIEKLSEKEKELPMISFIHGKMYFMIPWSRNLFKVDLSTKIEDANYFLPYLDDINFFEEIVKDLNLNTRIWSKV